MSFLEILGYLLIGILVFKISRSILTGIYLTFIAPILGLGVNWKGLAKWAVVTGSTDGIGKAYAEALARKGFNIVLISRTQEKLDAVAKEIETKAVVKTKTIAVNFSGGPEIYESIRKGLEGLDIGVLINNVGTSYEYPEFYTMIPNGDKLVSDILNTNALSCSMMMRLVLPSMSERRSGVIVNVSSLSSIAHIPLLAVYGASKAYMNYLSESLQAEYRSRNVIIQTLMPGFVQSKMSKISKTSFMVPSPKDYVIWAIKTVGIESNTAAYPAHKLLEYVMVKMSLYAPSLSLSMTFKNMLGLRRAYFKKNKLQDPLSPVAKVSKKD